MIRELNVEVCAGCGVLPCLCSCKWPKAYAMLEESHTLSRIDAVANGTPAPPPMPPKTVFRVWRIR